MTRHQRKRIRLRHRVWRVQRDGRWWYGVLSIWSRPVRQGWIDAASSRQEARR